MDHLSLAAELAVNSYPGRGIVIGRSDDGLRAVLAYFIMGRSANSRNRVFTEKDGGIITEAGVLRPPYGPAVRAALKEAATEARP